MELVALPGTSPEFLVPKQLGFSVERVIMVEGVSWAGEMDQPVDSKLGMWFPREEETPMCLLGAHTWILISRVV